MRPHNIFPLILFLYFNSVLGSHAESETPVFPILNVLLDKLESCDTQIFHDATNTPVDWSSINIPVKIITNIQIVITRRSTFYEINIHKSRAAVHCKCIIFISRDPIDLQSQDPYRNLGQKINEWVLFAKLHLCYPIGEFIRRVVFDDPLMTIVSSPSERVISDQIQFWGGMNFKISVLFMIHGNHQGLDRITIALYQNSRNRCDAVINANSNDLSVFDITKKFAVKSRDWCFTRLVEDTSFLKLDIYSKKFKNPFNTRIYNTHLQNILRIVFSASNETLVTKPKSECISHDSWISDNEISTDWVTEGVRSNIITADNIGFEFLSCYRDEYFTFKIYITPFELLVWVVLFISIISIIAITTTFIYLSDFVNTTVSIWLFVVGTLFEECTPLPRNIEQSTIFRLILGTWCLMTVILTNCYNGIMITELNAPYNSLRPTVFDHLHCERMPKPDLKKTTEG